MTEFALFSIFLALFEKYSRRLRHLAPLIIVSSDFVVRVNQKDEEHKGRCNNESVQDSKNY